jgi:hypothetical protein
MRVLRQKTWQDSLKQINISSFWWRHSRNLLVTEIINQTRCRKRIFIVAFISKKSIQIEADKLFIYNTIFWNAFIINKFYSKYKWSLLENGFKMDFFRWFCRINGFWISRLAIPLRLMVFSWFGIFFNSFWLFCFRFDLFVPINVFVFGFMLSGLFGVE